MRRQHGERRDVASGQISTSEVRFAVTQALVEHASTMRRMEGDDNAYMIPMGWSIDNLPEEDVYKPKKKDATKKGLENFMEKDN